MATTLNDYLTETRRLLHDANATYWNDQSLTSFINRAMKQRDRDTGQNRKLVSFTLTAGTASYALTTVEPTAIDVLGLVLIFGNLRKQLAEKAYTTLGSLYQPYQGYQNVPEAFAKYGATAVRLAPIPNQAYTTEWDCLVVAADLVAATDPDPLPYPWTDPVPFLAAHFSKLELQQYDEADQFLKLYAIRKNEVLASARSRMLAFPYSDLAREVVLE